MTIAHRITHAPATSQGRLKRWNPSRRHGASSFLAIALTFSVFACVHDRPVTTAHDAPVSDPVPTVAAPTDDGTIRQILAIDDDRAVVVFVPHTETGAPTPTLALMNRDGSIGWRVPLEDHPLAGTMSTGIEIVGDAVSVAIAHVGENQERLDRLEIYGLVDGQRRAVIRPGDEYYGRESIVDRDERYDVLIYTSGRSNLLIASGATGERWRATIDEIPGHEIVLLPEVVAVHEDEVLELGTWRVFSRSDGSVVGGVTGAQTCSDGQRWYVLARGDLLEVDVSDLSTRVVMDTSMLPGGDGQTYFRDCTIIGDRPVSFVQREMTEGLVAVSPDDGSIEHVVSLGIRRYREGAIDPLPDRLHPVVATVSENEDSMYELGVVDLRSGGTSLEGGPRTWLGVQGFLRFDHGDTGGYVVAARGLIAIVNGGTGELQGRHIRRDTMAFHRTQLAGTHLWLPPAVPMQLGRDAPTVLDLSHPSDDGEVRAAVGNALSPPRTITCDTLSRAGHDGLGAAEGLGPVSPSRLPPWNAEYLAASGRRFACASPSATVVPLAWSVMEDDRPLRNHNVIALVEDTVDGAPLYTAVAMYRHATNSEWNVSVSFHNPSRPIRRFTSRPTTADLDAFVDQSTFDFADSWGQVLVGNLIDSNWVAATSERPTRHFEGGIEQPD